MKKSLLVIVTSFLFLTHLSAQISDPSLWIIEAESTASDLGEWKLMRTGDENFVKGASKNSYLEFQGNAPDTGEPNSPLIYNFKAPVSGNFRLLMMASKRLEGVRGDLCNDAFIKMNGDFETATTLTTEELTTFQKYFQEGSVKTPELAWHWGIRAEKGKHQFHNLIYKLKKGKDYTLTLAGRSQRFSVDYFVLYDNDKLTLDEAKKLAVAQLH